MIVERAFETEDWARGFAEVLEYVNDGAISDIEVKRVNDGRGDRWIVSFEDEDENCND